MREGKKNFCHRVGGPPPSPLSSPTTLMQFQGFQLSRVTVENQTVYYNLAFQLSTNTLQQQRPIFILGPIISAKVDHRLISVWCETKQDILELGLVRDAVDPFFFCPLPPHPPSPPPHPPLLLLLPSLPWRRKGRGGRKKRKGKGEEEEGKRRSKEDRGWRKG